MAEATKEKPLESRVDVKADLEAQKLARKGWVFIRYDPELLESMKKAGPGEFLARCAKVYREVSPKVIAGENVVMARYQKDQAEPTDVDYLSGYLL